ncbi:TOBE domain-containing protein, partial [Xanthomonas oryzae]|uniref:TOBE domain-containing protein n=1 Tax=Xanthomonas oryzae TaxID=347 RepID=UPI00118063BE
HDQVEAITLANRIVIMRDGHVQQVGAPLEVYDRPVNLFVAGFIGSPEMNLVEGRAANGVFESGALRIALPEQYRAANEDIVFGIRPEHIALGEGPDALAFEVVVIEQLGAQTLTIGEVSGVRLRILTDRVDNWKFGQRIPVRLQAGRLHLFSKSTGQRL